jgi:hypothetical protein
MLFPYNEETRSLLWRCGYDVTPQSAFRSWTPPLVEGRFAPMPHQLTTAEFLVENPRAYVTSEMRTGKTASVAMALKYLKMTEPGAALIVCPVSVMDGVWGRALEGSDPDGGVGLLRGPAPKRRKVLERPVANYVINYDGLGILEPELHKAIQSGRITKIVIDELSHYGNPSAMRYKAAERLFNLGPRKPARIWGLTGTPGADTVAVYGYCRMVNYANMPWKSQGAWQSAIQYKWGSETWMWRDKPEAPRLVQGCLQPCIRFTRKEVLKDLPPLTMTGRSAEMSREQGKAYAEMKRWLVAEFGDGQYVEAKRKAELLGKLFQICLGQVITAKGESAALDNRQRLDMMSQLIAETDRKAVVFCSYTAALLDLEKGLAKRGHEVARVDGSVSGTRRDAIFRDFQTEGPPNVLVAHPITTAYGTELAAADLMILNGPMMSGVHTYMQGLARLSSAKQTAGQINVIELSSSPEEREFFRALRNRTDAAVATGNLFGRIVRNEVLP